MTSPPPPGTGYHPEDLSQPLYGADVAQAFVRFWQKFVVFRGRASPSEFWWWILISVGISTAVNGAAYGLFGDTPYPPVMTPQTDPMQYLRATLAFQLKGSAGAIVWSLVTLIGLVALSVRRLHDTARSGWWNLVALVPLVGWLVLIVFWAEPPRPGGRRYDG